MTTIVWTRLREQKWLVVPYLKFKKDTCSLQGMHENFLFRMQMSLGKECTGGPQGPFLSGQIKIVKCLVKNIF